jgi:hypothetical protein
MKIVREYLEFEKIDFERGLEPYKELRIGKKQFIEKWLSAMGIEKYRLNKDLSIDVLDDANLVGKDLERLPEYIKFNRVFGGFYAGGNNWQTLRGFPEEINGDLQLKSPSAPMIHPDMKRFHEDEIRKLIKVYGQIYN